MKIHSFGFSLLDIFIDPELDLGFALVTIGINNHLRSLFSIGISHGVILDLNILFITFVHID